MVQLRSKTFDIEDDYEVIYADYCKKGWSEGLPIVPPTKERVERMVSAVTLTPDTILGEMGPAFAKVSVEGLAVNAVMAGCLPEYFPVIVTAITAALQPEFNIYGINCTTSAPAICVIVNGPIRNRVEIN